jgi:NADPH-ferrihemoprotein reductase
LEFPCAKEISDGSIQGKDVVIFWGSQSGRSERLAKSLARECQRRGGIKAMAADLDDYDHQHLSSMPETKYVGFVVSTFGEGDPSDNAVELYEYLIELQRSGQKLSNLRYFAFGLGNTKYQHFNKFVDEVDETLVKAGARRLGSVGKEDEALRSDDTWTAWKETILVELATALGQKIPLKQQDIYEADFEVVDRPSDPPGGKGQFVYMGEHNQGSASAIKEARLLSRVVKGSTLPRDYLHIEFDIGTNPTALSYRSGDHVAVWPMNADEEVNRLARLFGWNDETLKVAVDIKARNDDDDSQGPPVPTPTTRAALLRYYLDVGGAVSRETAKLLSHFAPTARAKEYLQNILSVDNLTSQSLTFGRLMELAEPTPTTWPINLFDLLIQHLPLLQPRYFSIASSPVVQSRRLAITVTVVVTEPEKQNNPNQNQRPTFYGLATNYLYSLYQTQKLRKAALRAKILPQNDDMNTIANDGQDLTRPTFALSGPRGSLSGGKAFIQIRTSPFKLPDDPRRPILMMAAGSGIAPFRAFVQERAQVALAGRSNAEVGRMLLFFGCRSKDEDFLYEAEWNQIQEKLSAGSQKSLFEIDCAFSRPSPSENKEKEYVQDRVLSRRDDVLKFLLEDEACWYICGRIQLATGAKSAVKQILSESQGWTAERSESYIEELKRSGRLKEDVWA